MQLIETQTGPREHAGKRSRGSTSPARRGGEAIPVAPRSLAARLGRLRSSVWLPLVAKAVGLLAGMLALAAIGASSLANGPGVYHERSTTSIPASGCKGSEPITTLGGS